MKTPNLLRQSALLLLFLVPNSLALAQSGTWTNLNGGLWGLNTNWSGNNIANGADFTADFSTLNISLDRSIALDSPRTIGNLIFGDATTPGNNWTLNNNGSGTNILTLSRSPGTPTITVNNQTATISLELAGNNGMTKAGAGALVLSGINTYTGTTTVSGGSLTLSGSLNSSSLLALGAATFTYAPSAGGSTQSLGGTTLNLGMPTITNATSGNTLALGTITRNAGGVVNVASLSGTTTTKSFIDATGILGTWATTGSGTGLTYANGGSPDSGTTAGAVTAYTGTAAATAADVTDTLGSVNYDVAAVGALTGNAFNTLRYTGTAGTITGGFSANGLMNAGTGTVAYSGGITIGSNKDLVVIGNTQATTLSGIIANNGGGASSLTYAGNGISASTGILSLSGANTYSGGTFISSGAARATTGSAFGSGAINVASGAQLQISNVSVGNTINLTGGNSSIYTIGASGTATITGTINLLGNAGQSGTTSNNLTLTYSNTSVLNLNGFSFSFNPPGGSQSATFNGVINGGSSSAVSKGSNGSLTISGDQSATFSGPFTLSQGGLLLGNDGSLGTGTFNFAVANDALGLIRSSGGAGADRTIANAITLSGNSNSRHQFGSTGGAKLTFTNTTGIALAATRKIDVYSAAEFHAPFTGTGGLSVNGPNTGSPTITQGTGTLILTGASTYTGATTVSSGTLLVNGSLTGSAVTVNGGTLGGSGTISSVVTTGSTAGVISPGNSPGTLTLSGGLNASAGATFVFELGTSADLLNLGSGVFTGSSAANGLVFNFSDSGGLLAGSTYTLSLFGSSTNLDYTDLLASSLPSGYILNSGFGTNGFLINPGSLQVQFTAVPEPSSVVLLGLSAMALYASRRRCRR